MSVSARQLALQILYEVSLEGSYANLALAAAFSRCRPEAADRAFCTELVYGTLRQQGTLDYILSRFCGNKMAKLPPRILLALRLGAYQLLYMSKVPPAAAVNESVKLARRFGHQGTAGLVNAVLRNIDRRRAEIAGADFWPDQQAEPAQYLAARYSHPLWLAEEWLNRFGFDDTAVLCSFNNRPAPYTLRVNTLQTSREDVREQLAAAGITANIPPYPAEALQLENGGAAVGRLIDNGLLYPQQLSSMLAAPVLDPQPGQTVLDVCAAPGGKTCHLAALMQNRGHIYAFDAHEHKVKLIEQNARRLGIGIITAAAADSRHLDMIPDASADRILVDAPCSGLGVLRSRPDSRWRKQPETSAELAELSYQILNEAVKKLKPGGRLLFSTCTISRAENEQNAARLTAEHTEMAARPIEYLPEVFAGKASLQLLPFEQGLEGFFFALFEKKQ